MLRVQVEKVDDIQKQVSNISSEIETLRKDEKEMLGWGRINNWKMPLICLISKLKIGDERINGV